MPAHRVEQQAISIARFDVVGQDADAVTHFVRHVGLSDEQRNGFRSQDTLSMTHMGPPLERAGDLCPLHTRGTVPLTVDEIQQINVFVEELMLEYRAHNARESRQYVIRPHVRPERATDGTVVFYRFNCAGFVIEAYREAGIDLLVTSDDVIPPVSLATLINAYPDMASLLQNPAFRSRYELLGDGPWPVVLAGYVINALARQEGEIRALPHQPAAGDEYYPSRREGQAQT